MKVSELIERLRSFDQNATVLLETHCGEPEPSLLTGFLSGNAEIVLTDEESD